MQRVGTIVLAILSAIVFAGAVYVIGYDGGTRGSTAASVSTPPASPATMSSAPSAAAFSPSGSPSIPAPSGATSSPSENPSDSPSTTGSTAPSGGSSTATGSTPVVAFLGDDWTDGAGASSHAKRFTTLLSTQLGLTEKNFGADGTGYAVGTASAGDYASRVDAVIAAHPDVVVVSGGRNDADTDPGTVSTAATKLFTALVAGLPKAKIIVIAPFWGDSDKPARLEAVASVVQQAAERAGATYLDIEDPIHNHSAYMADAADPDDEGYAAIAAALSSDLSAAIS